MKPETKLAIGTSFLLLFFWSSCSTQKNKEVKEVPLSQVKVLDEQRIITPTVVDSNSIYFRSGSAKIPNSYKPLLDEKAQILRSDPSLQIYLTGHSDIVGSRDENNKLALLRAQAVKSALMIRGVYAKQIFVKSMGESKAQAISDPQMMQKDRRVDLEIRTPSRLSKNGHSQDQ